MDGSLASVYMLTRILKEINDIDEIVKMKVIYCSIDRKHRKAINRIVGIIKENEILVRVNIVEIMGKQFDTIEEWLTEEHIKEILNIDSISNLKLYIGLSKDNGNKQFTFEESINNIMNYPVKDICKYDMLKEMIPQHREYFRYVLNCCDNTQDYYCGNCKDCHTMDELLLMVYSIGGSEYTIERCKYYYDKYFHKEIYQVQVALPNNDIPRIVKFKPEHKKIRPKMFGGIKNAK